MCDNDVPTDDDQVEKGQNKLFNSLIEAFKANRKKWWQVDMTEYVSLKTYWA